jgi:hypothetical protein
MGDVLELERVPLLQLALGRDSVTESPANVKLVITGLSLVALVLSGSSVVGVA